MKILDFRGWQQEHGGTYGDYLAYAKPLEAVQDELDNITGTLPGTVFRAEDGSALFLGEDSTYVILVTPETDHNGRTRGDEAYLVTQPPVSLLPKWGEEDLDEITGFASGWTC